MLMYRYVAFIFASWRVQHFSEIKTKMSIFALQTKIENLYYRIVCQVTIKQKRNNQTKRRIGNVKYVFAEFSPSIMFLFCVRRETNRKCCSI